MSNTVQTQQVVAVSSSLAEKNPGVNNVLSSPEQEIYPTVSNEENRKVLEFQTDQNYYSFLWFWRRNKSKVVFKKPTNAKMFKTNTRRKQKNLEWMRNRGRHSSIIGYSFEQYFFV